MSSTHQQRSEINRSFLRHLREDFERHGADVIERVRMAEPEKYLAIVAKLMPSELAISVTTSPLDSLTDEQLELLALRLRGCEKFLDANCTTIDAIALPQEPLALHKDIID